MRIGVTGVRGKVGQYLNNRGFYPVTSYSFEEDAFLDEVRSLNLDYLVHAGSMTDVYECEADIEKAILYNSTGGYWVSCLEKVRVIYLSTDHVFNKRFTCREFHEPNPPAIYGATKLAGENFFVRGNHLTVRLSTLVDDDLVGEIKDKFRDGGQLSDVIQRGFMPIHWLFDQLFWIMQNWYRIPEVECLGIRRRILHIGGGDSISYYRFGWLLKEIYSFPGSVEKRPFDARNMFRPKVGGLDTTSIRLLGMGVKSIFGWDGYYD